MALQLIYTSAPRLLEAGRTGFGTVARHRAVSGLLAAAVERVSQFARLPGHDPRRIVHAYRVLTVGAATYHVLSCLRDAGSDYTGRTNHIAHHLIAEEREVRPLAAMGITPADVLRAMPWRDSWTGAARFLEPADEVDLASLGARRSQAWAVLTGTPDNARLPWSPTAQKGCYFIVPPEAPVLELFSESQHEKIQQAWQTTFTTSLEPNDEVGDFRWIGISSTSPLCSQAGTSARQLFDLLQPGSLPRPPEAEQAPAAPSAPGPQLTPAAPARERLPAPHQRVAGKFQPPPPSAAENAALPEATMLGEWSSGQGKGKPAEKSKSKITLFLVLAAVVSLLLSIGGVIWLQKGEAERKQETGEITREIDNTWKQHHLLLADTHASLKARAASAEKTEREQARQVLARYRTVFTKLDASLQEPDQGLDLGTPDDKGGDDFAELADAAGKWAATASAKEILTSWSQQPDPARMLVELDTWLKRQQAAWAKAAPFFLATRPTPQNRSGLTKLLSNVMAVFRGNAAPMGKPQEWRSLIQRIQTELKATASPDETSRWLDAWTLIEKPDADIKAVQELSTKLAASPAAPSWLKVMAESQAKKMQAALSAAAMAGGGPSTAGAAPALPETKPVAEAAAKPDEPDSLHATHPVYIMFTSPGNKAVRIVVPALAENPKPKFYVGGVLGAFPQLQPWHFFSNAYRSKMMVVTEGQIAIEGQDMIISDFAEGRRVVARSEDDKKVLFEAKVIVQSADLLWFAKTPVFHASDLSATRQTLDIAPLLERLVFPQDSTVVFSLMSRDGKSQKFDLKKAGETYTVATPVVISSGHVSRQSLQAEIDTLRKEIKKDEDDIQKLEAGNIAKAQKEDKLKKLRDGIEKKTGLIAEKQAEMERSKLASTSPILRILPGSYDLNVEPRGLQGGHVRRICEIEVKLAAVPTPPNL